MSHLVSEKQGLEFQIEMTADAIEYHQNGDVENGESPCCTADEPCKLRQAVTDLNTQYRAQLAALKGNGQPVTAPEAEKPAQAGGVKATRTVADPASDKQIGFIKSLAARADLGALTATNRRNVEKVQADEVISKRVASGLITALKAVAVPAASDAQIRFITSLAAEKGVEIVTDGMSVKEASQKITELKNLPAAPKAAPVELEDGMYKVGDAIYKVQHAVHGSGRQYAKQLVENDGEWSFEFAAGAISKIRPEHRLTMEQAAEFGALYGTCCVCGRTLTDEKSIERGIGPVCAGRL